MKTTAAVLYEVNQPLVVEQLDIDEPKNGEVRVKIASAGVCHSDYHCMKGEWTVPLPMVLGHEAAGIVESIGPGVTNVVPGDHVILNFRPNCGWCKFCTVGRPVLCNGADTDRWMMFDGTARLHKNGSDVFHFARTASFSEYAVVNHSGVVKVRDDMPLDKACLVGCSVMTGVGAVINTAKVNPGDSVVVIGCGGGGLNVIQGAVLAGAGKIIAVDLLENKLGYALQFGATHVINAGTTDAVAEIHDLTYGGADHAFEAIGNSKTILQAYQATCLGGVTTIVGMAAETDEVAINCLSLPRTEKTIQGSWYGGARPSVDLPKMVDLYMEGKLKVDELVSRTYPFDQINEAYAALDSGEVARSILLFD